LGDGAIAGRIGVIVGEPVPLGISKVSLELVIRAVVGKILPQTPCYLVDMATTL